MFTSVLSAMPCLVLLFVLAEVLGFVFTRRELPRELDQRRSRRVLTIALVKYNLWLLLFFGGVVLIVLLPGEVSGPLAQIVMLAFLMGAAITNLRAFQARAKAGKPAVTLAVFDGTPIDFWAYLGLGILILIFLRDSTSWLITGLFYCGMAVMSYLDNKRGARLTEQGVCRNAKFVRWNSVTAYHWPVGQDKESTMTITYQDKDATTKSLTLVAPEWNRAHIETFLNQKVSTMSVQT